MESVKHVCPKCGKPMSELPMIPGAWQCPDYSTPLNDVPPFRFKCTGMEFTDEAVDAFDREIMKLIAERN